MTVALFKVFSIAAFVALSQAKTLDFDPGYNTSQFEVTTSDGYILSVFRISGSSASPPADGKIPVFLVHGLFSSAADWILLGPGKALAYVLADAGYDVWLGNCRGNTYSRKHKTLSPDASDGAFWQFSWHEIGIYDLPAMYQFILDTTNQTSLHYIGHSQGTTVFFVMEAMLANMRNKTRSMHALAPSAFLPNIISPFFQLFAAFDDTFEAFTKLVGYNEFLASDDILVKLLRFACFPGSPLTNICKTTLFIMFGGFDYPQLEDNLVSKILDITPAGASTKQFIHYLQIINSGKFRQYDYGLFENLKKYGKIAPPEYNLTAVSTPVFLHSGKNDWVTVPKDVSTLSGKLGNMKELRTPNYDGFNHLDFIYGKDVNEFLYDGILLDLSEY